MVISVFLASATTFGVVRLPSAAEAWIYLGLLAIAAGIGCIAAAMWQQFSSARSPLR